MSFLYILSSYGTISPTLNQQLVSNEIQKSKIKVVVKIEIHQKKYIVCFIILCFCKFVLHTVSFLMALLLTKTRVLANQAKN